MGLCAFNVANLYKLKRFEKIVKNRNPQQSPRHRNNQFDSYFFRFVIDLYLLVSEKKRRT